MTPAMKYTQQQARDTFKRLFLSGIQMEAPGVELQTEVPYWADIDTVHGLASAIKLSIMHWGGFAKIFSSPSPVLFGVFQGTPFMIEINGANGWPTEPERMALLEELGGWFLPCETYAEFLNAFTERFGLTLDEK